jgi:hypothetical protein
MVTPLIAEVIVKCTTRSDSQGVESSGIICVFLEFKIVIGLFSHMKMYYCRMVAKSMILPTRSWGENFVNEKLGENQLEI